MDLSKTIVLFDVDGTLTKSRLSVTEEMDSLLGELKKKVKVGLVGGSDLGKIAEQMSPKALDAEQAIYEVVNKYDYVFSENGLIAYEAGKLVGKKSMLGVIGEEKCQRFINFCLRYLGGIEIPVKRGNFIEFRTGMINVCPIGRTCSQEERLQFAAYDEQHKVRETMVSALKAEFGSEFGLQYSLGGQISIDCFPVGWDKTFCLQYVEAKFDRIYFFGDRTFPGGNDYELFADPRTIGHSVTSPEHTQQLLQELFFSS
ncbi:PREDICTED: phosphomannomutase-like [Rhagoletis zephyria]|uniref:phosphomannomutase-like n=1 Tax=Rhagoletis zephyria TaxID=28612 RepID=UPI0008115517|nr:PREDICTED: phosphomannomutase-like [Rhagoletis zephyria]KAH9396542.1 Phosphomannomutase 1 [Tyrophagus putrescentiae]